MICFKSEDAQLERLLQNVWETNGHDIITLMETVHILYHCTLFQQHTVVSMIPSVTQYNLDYITTIFNVNPNLTISHFLIFTADGVAG